MKKTYITPGIKVLRVTGTSMMAGSVNTPISDIPASGGGRAKGNDFFYSEDEDDSHSVWDDYKMTK